MNKQGQNGIGYCDYTWNVVGGCKHNCAFDMPDGNTTQCYAKTVAEGVAQAAYPDGFATHYWRPKALREPRRVKQPSVIFIDSMADLFGSWVPDWQIKDILHACRLASHHTFLSLTKNAPRLTEFAYLYPDNLWVGVSMPPSTMNGISFNDHRRRAYLLRAFDVLSRLRSGGVNTWMSFEPLSFDAGHMIRSFDWYHSSKDMPLDWAVIGAASRGKTLYQPETSWVINLLDVLEGIPLYMKENLKWEPIRTERAPVNTFAQL